MNASEDSTVLSSWKDIARYLGKGVRTVQRWERHLGLPVRRPNGAAPKSAVVLHRDDVDAWLATRFSVRPLLKDVAKDHQSRLSVHSTLKEGIRTARELRVKNQVLTSQLIASIQLLNERCDLLSAQAHRFPGESQNRGEGELTAVLELHDSPPGSRLGVLNGAPQ